MGKGDQQQRKPAKASSSAKAAEFVASKAAAGLGFGGFSGSAAVVPGAGGFAFGAAPRSADPAASNSHPAADGEPALSSQLDGEVAQALRHLSKRDATTKLKALQALRTLIKTKTANELALAMPPWVYLYAKLCMDNNRVVRTEAAAALGDLAAVLGKGIAPHIKLLMGPWWLAQFDVHTDAAAAARQSFQACFPGRKQLDVLLFCRADLLGFLVDSITSTPQQLGDPRKDSLEEMEDRQERVASGALLALATVLDVVSAALTCGSDVSTGGSGTASVGTGSVPSMAQAQVQEVCDTIGRQLSNALFYKTTFHAKSARIRGAAYALLRAAASHQLRLAKAGQEMQEELQRCSITGLTSPDAVSAVMGCIGEKDPGNHAGMWDMLLTYVKAYPACWGSINIKKMFIPRLLALLRHGCYGSHTTSWPALLPLCAAMPRDALGPPNPDAAASLLAAVWEGMQDATATTAARAAGAAAYQECTVWLLQQGAAVGADDYTLGLLRASLAGGLLRAALSNTGKDMAGVALSTLVGVGKQVSQSKSATAQVALLRQVSEALQQGTLAVLDDASAAGTLGAQDGALFVRLQHLVDGLTTSDPAAGAALAAAVGSWLSSHMHTVGFGGGEGSTPTNMPASAVQLLAHLVEHCNIDLHGDTVNSARSGTSEAEAPQAGMSLDNLLTACLAGPLTGPVAAAQADLLISCIEQAAEPSATWSSALSSITASGDREQTGLLLAQLLADRVSVRPATSSTVAFEALALRLVSEDTLERCGSAAGAQASAACPNVQLLTTVLGSNTGRKLITSPAGAGTVLGALTAALKASGKGEPSRGAAAAIAASVAAAALGPHGSAQLWQADPDAVVTLISHALPLAWRGAQAGDGHQHEDAGLEAGSQAGSDDYTSDDSDSEGSQSDMGSIEEHKEGTAAAHTSLTHHNTVDESSSVGKSSEWQAAAQAQALELWDAGALLRSVSNRIPSQLSIVLQVLTQQLHEQLSGAAGKPGPHQAVRRVVNVLRQACGGLATAPAHQQLLIHGVLWQGPAWCRWSSQTAGRGTGSLAMHAVMLELVWQLSKSLGVAIVLGLKGMDSLAQPAGTQPAGSSASSGQGHEGLVVEVLCSIHAPGHHTPSSRHAAQYVLNHALDKLANPIYAECVASAMAALAGRCLVAGPQHAHAATYAAALQQLAHHVAGVLSEGGAGASAAEQLLEDLISTHLARITPSALEQQPSLPQAEVYMQLLTVAAQALRSPWGPDLDTSSLSKVSECWLDASLAQQPLSTHPSQLSLQLLRMVTACFPASGGSAGVAGGSNTQQLALAAGERTKLLALYRLQASCGPAAAAAQRASAASAAPVAAVDVDLASRAREAVALLNLAVAYYCSDAMDTAMWRACALGAQAGLTAAARELEVLLVGVAGAVKGAAAAILGQGQEPDGTVALQLLVRLQQSQVLFKHPAYQPLTDDLTTQLAGWRLCSDVGPALQLITLWLHIAHTDVSGARAAAREHAAAALLRQHMDIMLDCHQLLLKLLAGAGAVWAMCSSTGPAGEHTASTWLAASPAWRSLGAAAAHILQQPGGSATAAAQAGLAAADSMLANVGGGVDGVDALLSLSLAPKQPLASAAYLMLVAAQGAALARVSFLQDGLAPEDIAEFDADTQPAVYLTMAGGIRPVVATALCATLARTTPAHVYLAAWGLVLGQLSLLAPTSGPGRALRQVLREVPGLVPGCLDALLPHLPIAQYMGGNSKTLGHTQTGAVATTTPPLVQSLLSAGYPKGRSAQLAAARALYGAVLRMLPASACTWFGDLRDRGVAGGVEAYTAAVESPALLAAEISALQGAASLSSDKFKVRASLAAREVVALMEVEDNASLELALRLPAAMPLRPADVQCRRQVGVSDTRLRKWLLSISSFLRNNNSGMSEAIAMWRQNVESEFAGMEPCIICYSVVSATNSALPRLQCRTCAVRFHPGCLYKWFKSSGKSLCPHCQSPWQAS